MRLPSRSLNILLALLTAFLPGAALLSAQTYTLKAPIASKPALLISIGQSADVEMVKVLLDRSRLDYKADPQIKAGGLAASGAKTLIIAIGGSSKGLGAAGISADAELDRARVLLAEAKKLGLRIIGIHVGGEARRGELSDKFIQATVSSCDYVIVVAEGNADGLFTKLCAAAKIPLDSVEKITKAGDPLFKAFK
ncbi:MAG: DUF6305 family protein [Spirochaetota bacterium]